MNSMREFSIDRKLALLFRWLLGYLSDSPEPILAQRSPGHRLGLAIAKWIADVHHAMIRVHSQGAVGTVFGVTFPLSAEARVSG